MWIARRAAQVAVAAALVLAFLFIVVLSPWMSVEVSKHLNIDWNKAATVSTSYGAASAILAGLALCGVVISVVLQIGQSRTAQLQASRTLHLELLQMALTEPDYRNVLGEDFSALDETPWRQHAYVNLWIMYLQMAYLTRALDDSGVRRILAGEIFNGPAGLNYWQVARDAISAETKSYRHAQFLRCADQEYAAAIARRPVPPTDEYTE